MEILLGQSQQGGGIAAFLPFILIMFIIYFLMIRPQTKRQKEKEETRVVDLDLHLAGMTGPKF